MGTLADGACAPGFAIFDGTFPDPTAMPQRWCMLACGESAIWGAWAFVSPFVFFARANMVNAAQEFAFALSGARENIAR